MPYLITQYNQYGEITGSPLLVHRRWYARALAWLYSGRGLNGQHHSVSIEEVSS